MEYSQEPRLIFSPLTPGQYACYYNLEMASFDNDAKFYSSFLHPSDKVLELGCGNGRLTRLLAQHCNHITGIDISLDMLKLAQQQPGKNISYKHGDMRELHVAGLFDVIIIPLNTLNLLEKRADIKKCLSLCRKKLNDGAQLLLHLSNPNQAILDSGENKIFQFKIMEQENGTKVIKETLKSYCLNTTILTLEERYRIRPVEKSKRNRDYKLLHSLFCPGLSFWQQLLPSAGFHLKYCWGDFDKKHFLEKSDSTLLIQATSS